MIRDQNIKTKGSLCSGTGALDAAVPGELIWVAEMNESAASTLKRAHPGVPNLGNIVTADWASVPPVDLLTSGDPCQSISVAGRQMASEDERFLWPDVMNVIETVKPREIFLENVSNITSVALVKGAADWRGKRGSVLKLRLDNLREAGYAVKWTVLGACSVGAPHHRHRWFLRAWHVGSGAPAAERVYSLCGAPQGGPRVLLPSPTTADGTGGPGRSDKRAGGDNLRTAVLFLPSQGWGRFAPAIERWEQVTCMPAPEPTEPNSRGGRRLNPRLSEWMMGLPPGFLTDHLPRNEALRCAGNGVVSLQATAAWELLAPDRIEDGRLF